MLARFSALFAPGCWLKGLKGFIPMMNTKLLTRYRGNGWEPSAITPEELLARVKEAKTKYQVEITDPGIVQISWGAMLYREYKFNSPFAACVFMGALKGGTQ